MSYRITGYLGILLVYQLDEKTITLVIIKILK
jgi:hypothetical protein